MTLFKLALAGLIGLALAMPASAQETRAFTDDAGRTLDIPTEPRRSPTTRSG